MKKKELLLFFSSIFFLHSCSEDPGEFKSDFDKSCTVFHLHSNVLIGSGKLADPWVILNIDSLLIVGNKKSEPLVEFYSMSGRSLAKMTKKGRDSLDVRFIASLQPDYINHSFFLYDLFSKKILKYFLNHFSDSAFKKPSVFLDCSKLNIDKESYDKVYVWGNSFIGLSRKPPGRILAFNKDGSGLKYFLSYPEKVDPDISDHENALLYPASIAFSPDRSKFAIATYTAGVIDVVRSTPSGLDSVWSYRDFLPNDLKRVKVDDTTSYIAFSNNSLTGYSDIVATDKFIFAIFSGKRIKDGNYTFSNKIRVFSWDGKLRYSLILDIPINRLTVSKDNTVLYGISMNEKNEPEIISCNLKNIFP